MLETLPRPTTVIEAKTQPALAPKSQGWPGIGSLPDLLKNPFGFMVEAREKYGDLYRLNLGLAEVYVCNHPRHAQHVLVDHAANYYKGGAMWDAVRGMLGNGLVVSDGDFWKRQRRMMQPQFHRQRLAAITDLMVAAINEALTEWEKADPHTDFALTPAFNHLTMKVITRTLFGMGLPEKEMDEFAAAVTFALDYVLQAVVWNAFPKWMPVPGRKKFKESVAIMDKLVYGIIADSRQGKGPVNNLLALLLDLVDEETGEGMTDQHLRDEVLTLFLAGYETTSLTLSWAYDFLSRRPELMQKLQAEVDSVLGGRTPTFADLPKLTYTKMVISETLRLRPSAWELPRTATEEDVIDGYRIPAGATVVTLIYNFHRHPDEWADAEQFDPERFAAERVEKRHKLAWMPFGAGQRMCIGKDFALMEGQLALAMVAQRFAVQPVAPQEAEPELTGTLRPKGGVPVRLSKRS